MPDSISVSQVNTYLMCPRKYRYRYIERRDAETRSADMAFGSAVHGAIEWWGAERIAGRSPTVEAAQRIFRVDWSAQCAPGDLDFEDRPQADFQAMGETLVALFIERFAGEPPPVAVEQWFSVELRAPDTGEPLPIPLVGVIDFTREGVVGEIKTAARKTGVGDWHLQLSAYSYAVREVMGQRPSIQVVELIKTKIPKIEVIETAMTDRDEAWFIEVAVEVYRAIQLGAFFPSPSWACTRCEFGRACKAA